MTSEWYLSLNSYFAARVNWCVYLPLTAANCRLKWVVIKRWRHAPTSRDRIRPHCFASLDFTVTYHLFIKTIKAKLSAIYWKSSKYERSSREAIDTVANEAWMTWHDTAHFIFLSLRNERCSKTSSSPRCLITDNNGNYLRCPADGAVISISEQISCGAFHYGLALSSSHIKPVGPLGLVVIV